MWQLYNTTHLYLDFEIKIKSLILVFKLYLNRNAGFFLLFTIKIQHHFSEIWLDEEQWATKSDVLNVFKNTCGHSHYRHFKYPGCSLVLMFYPNSNNTLTLSVAMFLMKSKHIW